MKEKRGDMMKDVVRRTGNGERSSNAFPPGFYTSSSGTCLDITGVRQCGSDEKIINLTHFGCILRSITFTNAVRTRPMTASQ